MRVTNLPLIFGYWTLLLGCNPAPESVPEFAPEFVLQSRPENRCAPFAPGEPVAVSRVIDGDTLHLVDGRRVRLIGVNTPEMGHGDEPDQA
ncbi:MAG: thermonuclease family protein, partial [bacterium]